MANDPTRVHDVARVHFRVRRISDSLLNSNWSEFLSLGISYPMDKNYQLGLLHFIHLLIRADGVADHHELDALSEIKLKENISEAIFLEYEDAASKVKSEEELYQRGMDHLGACSDDEKLKIFATLYKLSEVDGRVHAKEIRLLLYSVKTAGIGFNDVVDYAKANPSII